MKLVCSKMRSYISSTLARLKETRRDIITNYKSGKLQTIDDITACYREPGIVTGYRTNYTLTQIMFSLFRVTNETANFWTHFLASLFFFWKFYSLTSEMPLFSDPYFYPLTCYLLTTCLYPLTSSLAHAFCCLSPVATNVCFFLDYAALALYSWGAALLYAAYVLPHSLHHTLFSRIFLPVAAGNAVLAVFLSCSSRFSSDNRLSKTVRMCGFVIPYLWDSIPLVIRLVWCDVGGADPCTQSGPHHLKQFLLTVAAAVFYRSHVPETLAPGYFDAIGNSHNLMHVVGVMATLQQMEGSLIDMIARKEFLGNSDWIVSPMWTLVVTPLIILCEVVTIAAFTGIIVRHKHKVQPFLVKDLVI